LEDSLKPETPGTAIAWFRQYAQAFRSLNATAIAESFSHPSRPYLPAPLAIVSRTDTSAALLHDVAVLAARRGTTAERYIRRYGREVGLMSESNDELYEALTGGRVDAVIDDLPIAGAFARRLHNLHVARLPGTDSAYALLLRKGNHDLQSRVDAVLADMESSGTLTRLQERWQIQTAA
jgi:ABC-type amino acid transport substrate-binding protein